MYEDRLYWYAAELRPTKRDPLGVVDGDTFNVTIDFGCFTYIQKALRVANINAPEMSTDAGKAAKVWALAWMAAHAPDGGLIIHTHLDPSDKYGRVLAMVYSTDGHCYNDDIIAEGHAVPFEVEPY